MYQAETKVRVRYVETDQMGIVYYGVYTQYFEVGRVEALRELGLTYKQIEEEGSMLPVAKLEVKYIRPAKYDDLLTVRTTIKEMPGVRLVFHHEVMNEQNELLTVGKVELVFVDPLTKRPKSAPQNFLDVMKPFFTSEQ